MRKESIEQSDRGRGGVVRIGFVVLLCSVMWAAPCWHAPVHAASALQQGQRAYNAFQFAQAIQWLRQALHAKPPLQRAARVRAAVYQAMSHYSLGQLQQARQAYETALSWDRRGSLPSGQSPALLGHFQKLRADWLRRHPAPVKRPRPPRLRQPARRRMLPKRGARLRRTQPPLQPPPKPGFAARHKASLVLLGVSLAVLGGGIGAAVVYQGHNQRLVQLQASASSGASRIQAYNSAFTPGLIATILYSTAGALGAVTIGVFIAGK